MRNIYFYFLFLFFFTSCTSDDCLMEEVYVDGNEITEIRAIIPDLDVDDAKSRTSFTTGPYGTVPNPEWIVGDSIGIYPDEGDQLSFRITTGGKTCPFSGGGWAMKASSSYIAYSPFQRSYYFKEKSALPVNMLGQTQKGNDNSAHLSAYDILIAKGDKPSSGSLNFQFTRQVALVRMELKAPCAATWKTVTLESNAAFTTKATMNLSLATPTITATAQSNTVTLALENVKTTSDNLNIIAYTMLLPVDLTGKTLSVKLTDVDDNVYTANAAITNNKTQFAANAVRWISAEFEAGATPTIPYITFSANELQALSMSESVDNLEYSVNGGKWKTLGTTTVTFGGNYGELRLRGKNSYGTARSASWPSYSQIKFSTSAHVACTGDIRTLIDYENYSSTPTDYAKFCWLFGDCYQLTSAPLLPAVNLASECYYYMFSGCSGLTEAPELPATTLAKDCYSNMFSSCSGLTEAPVLPATSLADYCYYYMFSGCSGLTEAPELPATTLAKDCYSQMFSRCSGLTEAPELPATIMEKNCYEMMFNACTSLTKAPILPATTLADYCYSGMFIDCTSLTEAPELPLMDLSSGCYSKMFSGCSGFTEAPLLPAVNLASECYYEMFSDCSGLTEAPELPAEIMSGSCYSRMFYGCTSLEKAPELPATVLAERCYGSMFSGCTSLTEAPLLPATTLATYCYSGMFMDCTSLTEAPSLPATILAESCYSSMFRGCTSLLEAPLLPATTLATYCYSGMFMDCTSLTEAPSLPSTILALGCYGAMFNGCISLTKAPLLPATTLVSGCYGRGLVVNSVGVAYIYTGMFKGCSNLISVTMLATDISDNSCMEDWLSGVSSTGTFVKAPEMTTLPIGSDGIPSGWTVVDYEE